VLLTEFERSQSWSAATRSVTSAAAAIAPLLS
jgi:hypothetical protein